MTKEECDALVVAVKTYMSDRDYSQRLTDDVETMMRTLAESARSDDEFMTCFLHDVVHNLVNDTEDTATEKLTPVQRTVYREAMAFQIGREIGFREHFHTVMQEMGNSGIGPS